MPSLPTLFAPLALLLPFSLPFAADAGEQPVGAETAEQTREGGRHISPMPLSREAPAWSPLLDGVAPANSRQVRIERRVILRISPARGQARRDLTAETRETPQRTRVVERKAGKCLDSAAIGGVTDRGDRLLLFMRDRRTFAAKLEKGCRARDFYQGAYMERSEDGKLCVARDRIMSRSGAKCKVESFSELVVERVD